MASTARASLVSRLVRLLPGPLLRALDAWSHRLAQRRYEARRQRWLRHQAALASQQAK